MLIRLKEEGKTVFLNSHLLSELEMVCDRVSILVQGEVSMQGTLDELTADSQRYEITIKGDAPGWAGSEEAIRTEVINGTTRLILMGTDTDPVQPLIDKLREGGITIIAIKPVRETLEDLFMRAIVDPATGGQLKIGAAPAPESATKGTPRNGIPTIGEERP